MESLIQLFMSAALLTGLNTFQDKSRLSFILLLLEKTSYQHSWGGQEKHKQENDFWSGLYPNGDVEMS